MYPLLVKQVSQCSSSFFRLCFIIRAHRNSDKEKRLRQLWCSVGNNITPLFYYPSPQDLWVILISILFFISKTSIFCQVIYVLAPSWSRFESSLIYHCKLTREPRTRVLGFESPSSRIGNESALSSIIRVRAARLWQRVCEHGEIWL